MTAVFSIQYNTAWGENLILRCGHSAHAMNYTGDGLWQVTLTGRDIKAGQKYSYEVMRDGNLLRREWRPHKMLVCEKAGRMEIRDRWIDRPWGSAFFASAFKDVIFGRNDKGQKDNGGVYKGNVVLRCIAAEVRPHQTLAIAGSGRALGHWQVFHPMNSASFPWWEISFDAKEPFEYKFVIVDNVSGVPVLWEEGPNHAVEAVPGKGCALALKNVVPKLNTIPWRGAGVAVPVFSLRSKDSFGVGEFRDIKLLARWAACTGQNLIQLLPINDTTMTGTWRDSYPYNAVSSFALHPQFINLPAAGVKADRAYKKLQAELNALPQIDYEKVNGAKLDLLRRHFEANQAEITAGEGYKAFVAANLEWMLPYAVFSCLRDACGTVDYTRWGGFAVYSKRKAQRYADAHPMDVAFWYWLQYQLDVQLKDAIAYAHSLRVAIKGDLPIGVSPTSVDAWTHPELFNMDRQAGAPPDAFSADGQNWGFPTYNWDRMAKDDFAWWKARLGKMSEYFDAYRIDHILGFFRIWEIPSQYSSGLMGHFSPALPFRSVELSLRGFDISQGHFVTPAGDDPCDVLFVSDPVQKDSWHPRIGAQSTPTYKALPYWQQENFNLLYNDFFYHRHDKFWRRSAMSKLPSLMQSTDMLSCGEDLGMIPSCVAPVLQELGILSLEIQRMPKDPREEFADPARYPYWCVCATGTHDTSTLRAWWEEDRAATQKYYNQMMHRGGQAPYYCEDWVAEEIVRAHLASPAMLAVLPLQDWLATDASARYGGDPGNERINIPANPRHYWRWRMHLTLEDLLGDKALCDRLSNLIKGTARGL